LFPLEHRLSMSSFHFCLSAAKIRSSFQLLLTSLVTDLLQLVLGLPLFLLLWGFHSRAAFGTSPSFFLNVWPIHLNFLFLISKFISSWPVALHKSLLEIIFGHHISSYNIMKIIRTFDCGLSFHPQYKIWEVLCRLVRTETAILITVYSWRKMHDSAFVPWLFKYLFIIPIYHRIVTFIQSQASPKILHN
jgi:hypothetical protein